MPDSNDVELHVEIVRARNDWAREKRQAEVRQHLTEIREQRAALRRCDQSLLAEERRLEAELPQQEPAMPRVVQQGPRAPNPHAQEQRALPEHLRKAASSES